MRNRIFAALAVAVPLIGGFEGLRYAAYRDPVGIPTICWGYTSGVKIGDKATLEQCEQYITEETLHAIQEVERCSAITLEPNQLAAFASAAYNVGGRLVCDPSYSTLARKLKAGDVIGACKELTRWVKAKGITLPGLVRRRQEEMELCLS